jgi:glycosyltransferase involved in cell wall biosynthesis
MFLHAGTDLYRDQVYLEQKLMAADNIIVVCDFNRRYIQSKYPDTYARVAKKILVHHLGLDLAECAFDPGPRNAGRLVCVGRLDRRKGFDEAIRALARLRDRGNEVTLELVGDGQERRRLSSLALKLGVAANVQFAGWQTAEGTSMAIRRACMLVHPSNGLGDAVPTVIKESMALGTPVVATDVAGIPELLDSGRCGFLVQPRDPVALAEAIEGLLRSPTRSSAMSQAARKFAEKMFDINRNGRLLAGRLLGAGAE